MKRSRTALFWENLLVMLALMVILCIFIGAAILTYLQEWVIAEAIVKWLIFSLMSFLSQDALPSPPAISTEVAYVCIGALFTSASMSVWITWQFRIRNSNSSQYKHLEGPRLLLHRQAVKHFRKKSKGGGQRGLYIHPSIKLPIVYEVSNFLVWGMQGSGKSNLIKYLVQQLIERKDRAVIYDMKGEYTQAFFLDKQTLLLSPSDQRSVYWCLGRDITTPGLAEAFAESVISSSATDETFWVDSARVVLIGVIVGLIAERKPWSWKDLAERVFASDTKLSALLEKHYPQAATLVNPHDKTTQSIRSMIATQLSWISNINQPKADSLNEFSITDWLLNNDKRTLIVRGDINSPLMSKALITALMSLLSNAVLSRSDEDASPIWLVVDELATINKSSSFERWLAQGRSKGCRTIAGVQLLSNLHSNYGTNDANTVLGLFGNIVTFRLGATGEAKNVASDVFGKRRIEYLSASFNAQQEQSYSLPQENIAVVTPEDIVSLPQPSLKNGIEGYLMVTGIAAAYRLRWPITKNLETIAPALVEQDKQNHQSKVKVSNRLNRREST